MGEVLFRAFFLGEGGGGGFPFALGKYPDQLFCIEPTETLSAQATNHDAFSLA